MDSDTEAPKDPGVLYERYTEQDYEGTDSTVQYNKIKNKINYNIA